MPKRPKILTLARAAGLCGALGACPRSAVADDTDARWLAVSRAAGALDCPDAAVLASAAEQLLASRPPLTQRLITVEFRRSGQRYVAGLLRHGADGGVRTLEDSEPDCRALAQAVATAVALMLETRSEPVARAPAPFRSPERRQQPRAPRLEPLRLGGAVRAGGASNLTGSSSGFLELELALQRAVLRTSIGGLLVPSTRNDFGPGHIDVSLIGATTRACVRWLDFDGFRTFACSGVFGGAVRARAAGYTQNLDETRPWLAVPVELAAHVPLHTTTAFASTVSAGFSLLAPIRRQAFRVDGLGTGAEQARFAALAWIGFDAAKSF